METINKFKGGNFRRVATNHTQEWIVTGEQLRLFGFSKRWKRQVYSGGFKESSGRIKIAVSANSTGLVN